MTGTSILILGGQTGLAGQAISRVFQQAGWRVAATSRQDANAFDPAFSRTMADLVEREQPDWLVNAIAHTAVDAAEDDVANASLLNEYVPDVLGGIAKKTGCGILHISTDFVFNGEKTSPYTVHDLPDPRSVYGMTKLAGERALLAHALPRCIIARTAWLFGPGRRNFVHTMLSKCAQGVTLRVVRTQTGSPTYTPDLAACLLALVQADATGVFHVVNSGQASWYELAHEAIRLASAPCCVEPVDVYPQKAERPAFSVLDTGSLTDATGITPRHWRDALAEYVAGYMQEAADGA